MTQRPACHSSIIGYYSLRLLCLGAQTSPISCVKAGDTHSGAGVQVRSYTIYADEGTQHNDVACATFLQMNSITAAPLTLL